MFKQIIYIIIFLLFCVSAGAQYKIRFEIIFLPVNTPSNSQIYTAGNFSNWNPQQKNFQFQKNENGYFLELLLNKGSYEYKITRGGWDKVECTIDGKEISNKSFIVEKDTTIKISVAGWKDLLSVSTTLKKNTANKNVQIINSAFYIPQLNRYRRIWVYLPASYNSTKKKYPVLYMHDGQNIFEDSTSFSGEWGVDEALDSLEKTNKESIVVAIDNGGSKRLYEYCPYDFSISANNMEKNIGEGVLYVDFLAKTLKPFIDKNYRTLKNSKNTFTAGSSMGGLISMYALLKYPKVFGGAGVFSPAFWVGPRIFDEIKAKGNKVKSKIYFYAGKEEGETMVPMTLKAFNEMHKVSKSKMTTVIRSEGKHNEARWRIEFPLFYNWLMK